MQYEVLYKILGNPHIYIRPKIKEFASDADAITYYRKEEELQESDMDHNPHEIVMLLAGLNCIDQGKTKKLI